MTEKRFDFKYDGVGYSYYLCDKEEGASYEDRVFAEIWADKSEVEDIVNKMNALHEENQSLKFQLDECRNHKLFSRRELEKENEELKHRLEDWHKRTFRTHEYFNILEKVIDEVCNDDISNKIWKEYEKREKLIE